jgi:subtilisin family serine protease
VKTVALAAVAAALFAAAPAAAFTPTDPLAAKQWYLAQDHAFDAWLEPPTTLAPVKVAIVDSGLDCSHPEFQDRIVATRSFVTGSACVDRQGHGTFVAGEIAANLDNSGVVGMAPTAQLLIAKVVEPGGSIPLDAEAAAIRWAADSGAKVINLSLGGVRDPLDRTKDTYSPLEARAVAYASSKGAVLVAAVGNSDDAPSTPWPYASYPAALPHVLGVSALARTGAVPSFSNRDAVYDDIAAPGMAILSTFPRALTADFHSCADQGYSDCGPDEYRAAEGTSFAAPQVSAAAAVLFAVDPTLRPEQVTAILEHSADDVNVSTGCKQCGLLHDPLSGWGRLDVARAVEALQGPLPPADRLEANDDAGGDAATVRGAAADIKATVEFYDDQIDVYRIRLTRGHRLFARLQGPVGPNLNLVLWKPGTERVEDIRTQRLRAAQSVKPGALKSFGYRVPSSGWYYLEVKATTPGAGPIPYSLAFAKK